MVFYLGREGGREAVDEGMSSLTDLLAGPGLDSAILGVGGRGQYTVLVGVVGRRGGCGRVGRRGPHDWWAWFSRGTTEKAWGLTCFTFPLFSFPFFSLL